MLRVHPESSAPKPVATTGRRPFETPLLIAGVRCTLRYIVLPLVLPLLGVGAGATLGVATGISLAILLILDAIATVAIVGTLRRLWRLQHPSRWWYLVGALALAGIAGLFLSSDARGA